MGEIPLKRMKIVVQYDACSTVMSKDSDIWTYAGLIRAEPTGIQSALAGRGRFATLIDLNRAMQNKGTHFGI